MFEKSEMERAEGIFKIKTSGTKQQQFQQHNRF